MPRTFSKCKSILLLVMLVFTQLVWPQSKLDSSLELQTPKLRLRIADTNDLSLVHPKKIVVGVRSDASPFSYKTISRVQDDYIRGYGGYMVEICRRVLMQMSMSGVFAGFSIQPYDVTAGNRYKLLNEGEVDMLCGSDSITLNRLQKYNASHPLFLSGLTYVSVENDRVPRTRYCSGVIGLVRNTTAESTGLQIIARHRELGRFHEPLEAFMAIMTDPQAFSESRGDQKIARRYLIDELLDFLPENSDTTDKSGATVTDTNRFKNSTAIDRPEHPADWIKPTSVQTSECPDGYDSGPVVFFSNHVEGLNALCKREILFYMGDFDIIRERLNGMSDCKTVMRRETLTDEAYGAYFRKFRGEGTGESPDIYRSSYLDSLLYAEFNNVLLQKMQSAENILDYEFVRQFGDEKRTKDLQQFFDSFKFASHY